jgi:hypothetical protein
MIENWMLAYTGFTNTSAAEIMYDRLPRLEVNLAYPIPDGRIQLHTTTTGDELRIIVGDVDITLLPDAEAAYAQLILIFPGLFRVASDERSDN